ncbi:MAG: hypothetical protein BWY19_00497 [bacterium ADurb.Bin212]|nr:MAG: hypothetical protein BWY19_00497 [bacterium ADurb.Bin212]
MNYFIRKKDWLILGFAALILGLAMAMHYSSLVRPNGTPSDDQTLAVEIEKMVKVNTDLKNQVSLMSKNNQNYKDSLNDQNLLDAQIQSELRDLKIINAVSAINGSGVEIVLKGRVLEAQLIDLINAIKNIGCDAISINGQRLSLFSPIDLNRYSEPYNIEVVGNNSLLTSALSRKGGIVEQLQIRSIDVNILSRENMELSASVLPQLNYLDN